MSTSASKFPPVPGMERRFQETRPTRFLGRWFPGERLGDRVSRVERRDGAVLEARYTIFERQVVVEVWSNIRPSESEIRGFLVVEAMSR